jgi:tetratricopeptide (TPR) repeat protein
MAKKHVSARSSSKSQPKATAKGHSVNPPPAAKAPKATARTKGRFAFIAVALLLTGIFYFSSIDNGFVNWDDQPNITENPNLQRVGKGAPWGETIANIFDREKGAVIGNYNPLPIFTFAIEKALAGGEFSSTLIHFDNLLLHLLTTLFVMLLLWRMGLGNWGALAGGLLFGLHPMRVESVAWATERKDVLFAVFFFAALVCYVRWLKSTDKSQRAWLYILATVLAILSLFSKVQAVTLPLSMLALDFWFRRPLSIKLIWEKTPFWLLSALFGFLNIITLRSQGSINSEGPDFTFIERLCIGAYSFCVYLGKLIIPHPLSPLYPYPKPLPAVVYVAPVLFLIFWAGIFWAWRKGLRVWVFGAIFFFFNVMFLLQVLGAGQAFLADRFTYVPYFGFFTIAAYYFDKFHKEEKWKARLRVTLGALTLVYGFWTVSQVSIWKDGSSLWDHVIKFDTQKSALPYWNRGQYFRNQLSDYPAALADYDEAVNLDKQNPEVYNSRGKTYFDMAMSGKYKGQETSLVQKAINDYNAALAILKIKPKTKSEILINRGAALGSRNQLADALKSLDEGIALDTMNKNGYLNRSLTLFNLAENDTTRRTSYLSRALADDLKYLELDPFNAGMRYESGVLQRTLGQNQEAIRSLTAAIELNPEYALAFRERARAYAQSGNKAAATQDYQRAGQLGAKMEALDTQIMAQ